MHFMSLRTEHVRVTSMYDCTDSLHFLFCSHRLGGNKFSSSGSTILHRAATERKGLANYADLNLVVVQNQDNRFIYSDLPLKGLK